MSDKELEKYFEKKFKQKMLDADRARGGEAGEEELADMIMKGFVDASDPLMKVIEEEQEFRFKVRMDRARRHANRKAVIAKENYDYALDPEFHDVENQLRDEYLKEKLAENPEVLDSL